MSPTFAGEPGHRDDPPKAITGYCDPWSLRAGESVTLRAASHLPVDAELAAVRISCGDPTSVGPGFAERRIATGLPAVVPLDHQPLVPGSFATVDLLDVEATSELTFTFSAMATRPKEHQTMLTLTGERLQLEVVLDDGVLRFRSNDADIALRTRPLANRRWYDVWLYVNLTTGRLRAKVSTEPSVSPGRDLLELVDEPIDAVAPLAPSPLDILVFGGTQAERGAATATGWRGDFDGRIARPRLNIDGRELWWDLAQDMGGRAMVDGSGNHRHGILHQLPTRAVTGPSWDGTHQRWTDDPSQWDAIHFHKDDLYDAGWSETAQLTLPADLPSGIYAFRLRSEHGEDRVPFFVRPADGAPTASVALLMSSATYLAYANHRMLFEGADFIHTRHRLRPEHEYVRQHPELGRSMYEKHPDGSGVMFSSRLRPVLNLRPGADGWNFTPDTDINAYLEHVGVGHDIIADEDLHREGVDALAPYRVLVTCSHPEYWSTAMLDALSAWQRNGGRLMYLGGNGFYWRVAFSDAWPGAMELRRAEDGVRNWQTGDGESYHAFTGEYGGMWRRNGRPPNELVGIGFAAQGFERASSFRINPESRRSRAAWIWAGVVADDGRIGTSGLGGGAAGQELDRYDTRLGSPAHAVVLASATEFGPDMVRTKEEFEGSVVYSTPDPYVRADIVFYETPGGGAVFSVGSISWFGALARNDYDNDVAKMTTNVLYRFVSPTPFTPPPS
ncbi:MAG: N,N-dimethylformamidase [Acidimicrobiia bacterium]|nr:N,N-dimethylformamidase [Acidimicrobiia bacterium]